MDNNIINAVLRKNCEIYRGVYPCDRLPSIAWSLRPFVIVANTDPSNRPGQHWICMYFDEKGHGEFFDSFGSRPNPIFELYMNKHCVTWKFNDKQFQSSVSRFCGHYSVWYCILKCRKVSLNSIQTAMTSDTGLNDYLVHRFVCRLI